MSIQLLSQDVAGKIAAGEVVERPANVVKELIENSLDAGASDIQVEVGEGGQRLLRVSDNGCGISSHELPLAVQRHATSKLRCPEDLDCIRTLGFRGEALYSMAAVSHMTISSRPLDTEAGAELRIEGGAIVQQRAAGLPVGTAVSVEHLFFNTPARRKFLRRPATEAGHIGAIIQRYALAYPHCRFSYRNDGRQAFQTSGNGVVEDVLMKIHGRETGQQLLPIGQLEQGNSGGEEIDFMPALPPSQPSAVMVSGFASQPTFTRANRSQIELFVNRRYVEDRSLIHAVIQAYHTLLPVGRYPLAVIFIEMDPADLDVNVHPRKTEVRFANARQVYGTVQRCVRRALVVGADVPRIPMEGEEPPDSAGSVAGGISTFPPDRSSPPQLPFVATDLPLPASDILPAERVPQTEPISPDDLPATAAQTLPPLRVVGQAAAMYVVAEGPEGLYLIDQHAAHERVLYERFRAQRKDEGMTCQGLLEPTPLHLGDIRAGLVVQHLAELNAIGFEIEPFGGDTLLVRAIPSLLSDQDALQVLDDVVQGLAVERDLLGEALEARLVKMVCKRASIKAGQVLSDIEMKELVRQLEQCRSPRTCPHGRPTMLQLSAGELERAFKRT